MACKGTVAVPSTCFGLGIPAKSTPRALLHPFSDRFKACGFVEEGRMREHVWLAGRYVDNVIMGVLREEWRANLTGDG